MVEKWESGDVVLYLGDCLEVMPTLVDGSVDVLITDPPYGLSLPKAGKSYGASPGTSRKPTQETWDDAPPPPEFFEEMRRVSKDQIVFGGNFFLEHLPSTPCYIVWDKRGNLPDVPFSPVEWVWTSYKRQPRRYIIRNHGFIRDSKEPRVHPTQKPLLLMLRIIEDFTVRGTSVLDPYMGSGTTGVACVQTGRRFIGIEVHEPYFEIAKKRIAEAQLQLRLL